LNPERRSGAYSIPWFYKSGTVYTVRAKGKRKGKGIYMTRDENGKVYVTLLHGFMGDDRH